MTPDLSHDRQELPKLNCEKCGKPLEESRFYYWRRGIGQLPKYCYLCSKEHQKFYHDQP